MSDEEFANAYVLSAPRENPFGNWTEKDVIRGVIAGLRAGREKAAKKCELTASEILLLSGELDKEVLRTIRAVLMSRAAAIRGEG